jgi:DnaJ-class molecular chaperone
MSNITVSKEQLHTNFIRLAKLLHPDHDLNNPNADSNFQELQIQYKKAQQLVGPKSQYQAVISISLSEAILGCERFFINDEDQKFVLTIPAGIKNKQLIMFRGLAVNSAKDAVLHIKVFIKMTSEYTIVGDRLILKIYVPFWKLFFGGKYIISDPIEEKFSIMIPKKTKNGKMFRFSKNGLWNRIEKKRDPLYIQIFGKII